MTCCDALVFAAHDLDGAFSFVLMGLATSVYAATVLLMPLTATRTAGPSFHPSESWCATLNTARVVRLMRESGIETVTALGRESGVSRRLLTDAMNGGPVTNATVARIAETLATPPTELMVWTRR